MKKAIFVLVLALANAAIWMCMAAHAMPYSNTYSFQCRPYVPHQTSRICWPPPNP
jgi:predicted phosphoadenosine phosphosulfate sulfurtransferase